MTTLIGASEAARTLGVTKPTLYAYVSRGLVHREVAVDGRTSLYDREEIETLASGRRRRRSPAERPSIDVQIATAVTHLHDDSPTYRGHRVLDLIGRYTFEEVADLLLCGRLDGDAAIWRPDGSAIDRAVDVVTTAAEDDPLTAMALAAITLHTDEPANAATTARSLISVTPSLFGGPRRGSTAERLARAWARRTSHELVDAIEAALILLADHELATSTLAVRVAASVRTEPSAAIAAGLHAVAGPLHGAASQASALLFDEAHDRGVDAAISRRLDAGERLPGFGHTVYRAGDPRFAPLLDAVRRLPGTARLELVDEVMAEAGRSIGHLPNVDLALGALYFVADLPRNAPVFAIARIAGWAAHYDEEISERPVRFRGLARHR